MFKKLLMLSAFAVAPIALSETVSADNCGYRGYSGYRAPVARRSVYVPSYGANSYRSGYGGGYQHGGGFGGSHYRSSYGSGFRGGAYGAHPGYYGGRSNYGNRGGVSLNFGF